MQESTPAPPIGGNWWQSRTFWASILSVVLALPTFVEQLAPFLNEEQRQKAMALSALAAALAAIFARMGGVQAAKDAAVLVGEVAIKDRIESVWKGR